MQNKLNRRNCVFSLLKISHIALLAFLSLPVLKPAYTVYANAI